jgi:hypothetical protein
MSSSNSSQFETAVMIRRVIFFLVLLTFAWLNLGPLFRGLSSPRAMEQAEIGRNISRGDGFTTKTIRGLAYYEAEKAAKGPVQFTNFKDTYHSPLNPLILGAVMKMVGGDNAHAWDMQKNEQVYGLDRIVALVSTLFFLMAIGVTYLLVSRIFDAKIAGVTALLMVLCDLFWRFSQSGLPQMLLLLLFSCGIYFTYRAVEHSQEGRPSVGMALIGAAFFVLMVLTHWLTAWIFIGYLIFAAVAFKPRGVIALSALALLAVAVALPMYRNYQVSGQPFGTGFYVLYNGLANGTESSVMRNQDLSTEPLSTDGLLVKILGTSLAQASFLVAFMGGIIAAPLFFISLLHPFKRASIANFRWAILLMWVFAAIGMALFGVDEKDPIDPNQIHILFAPIMAAYGLAFLSILWNRIDFVAMNPGMRNVHYIVIVVLSAAPLLLTLPQKVKIGMWIGKGGLPQWPPYMPRPLNDSVVKFSEEEDGKQKIVVSDQPWAVAWYADRISLWLPKTIKGFEQMEAKAAANGTPFTGILITPSSHDSAPPGQVRALYGEFNSLIYNGLALEATSPGENRWGTVALFGPDPQHSDPKLIGIASRYKHPVPLYGMGDMMYYSAAQITTR